MLGAAVRLAAPAFSPPCLQGGARFRSHGEDAPFLIGTSAASPKSNFSNPGRGRGDAHADARGIPPGDSPPHRGRPASADLSISVSLRRHLPPFTPRGTRVSRSAGLQPPASPCPGRLGFVVPSPKKREGGGRGLGRVRTRARAGTGGRRSCARSRPAAPPPSCLARFPFLPPFLRRGEARMSAAGSSSSSSLTPQVHWAQRHRELYLRVELSDVQNPDITIADNVLHFKAHGHGAKGDNVYEFQIQFLELVKPQPAYKVTQRQVNITVKKAESHWWERLTKQEKRPLFLAPDFDRWLDESDAEMELKAKEEERINKINIENRIPRDPFRHLKRGYLFMYNLVQFLGFSWIFVNMTVRLFMLGKDSFFDTFHTTADVMYFCQMLAVLEIVNTLIGLVRAPLAPVFFQVIGRNFILFLVLGGVEEMQSKAVVFFVFYIWSMIEIFRYPFYMLSCIDIEWKILTWIRYSIWIPLYPLGILAEAVCVIQAIPIFNSTGRFSFTLPYPLSFTIPFSVILQLHLVLLFLGPFVNFRHLYKQRKRHLGPKKRKMQ